MQFATLLESRVRALRVELEHYIEKELFKEHALKEKLMYALHGGKEIRGVLALFTAEVLAGDARPALPVALALELMHSASLIHDDIIDKSESRRGKESFWKRYGLEEAIVFPHIMMSTAIKYVARAGVKAVIESMDAWYRAALGQLWDIEILNGRDPGIRYIDIISHKTGAVFEASAVLPLYAVQYPESAVEYARLYGASLGRAYQILDDLVDIENGVRDSGSVVQLLRESDGDPLSYAGKIFANELERCLRSAMALSEELAYFAMYSLELFLRECKCSVGNTLKEELYSRWRLWAPQGYP
ncbi:polyprenyl synthetase family protein [Infirmifilum lucidum]|uniref:Polyprenyl synthetase family protein n=1 Tax=Infirmifilum lucidum TaxID=2776706 RepID=A0A7L9FFI2_9CREN|nr:polyprenyl synthetase family protein [Infirmifilum lucidum]QOJ78489.1 polyprenyl synthetase family protein [Infirmifilum lucidum]